MAGRQWRLWDNTENKWVYYNSEQEMDDAFMNDKSNRYDTEGMAVARRAGDAYLWLEILGQPDAMKLKNTPVNDDTKELDELVTELGKRLYGQAHPDLNPDEMWGTVKGKIGKLGPRTDELFYQMYPELIEPGSIRWNEFYGKYYKTNADGTVTDDIPENRIGSSERLALLAQSKDKDEEKNKWLSGYYNFIYGGGYDGMSDELKQAYDSAYAEKNADMISKKASYNPNDPNIFRGRALTALAGKGAIDRYLDEMGIPEDSEWRTLSGMSNTSLAKLAASNSDVSKLFELMMDHYMGNYYARVYSQYRDEPETISLDMEKYGLYGEMKEYINDTEQFRKDVGVSDAWYNKAWTGAFAFIGNIGNEVFNNYGKLIINVGTSIDNELRDRAKGMLDKISERQTARNLELVANLNPENSEHAKRLKESIGFTEEDFDNLAQEIYPYYKEHDNLDLTPDQKKQLYIQFYTEVLAFGENNAVKRFADRLQNTDYDNQGTFKRIGYTANNLGTTVVSTLANIGNFAYYQSPYTWVRGIYNAVADEGGFWSNLGDNMASGWEETLDNDFANWSARLTQTGAWTTGELKRLEELGIQSTPILRRAGAENDLFDTATLYDIVPVAGYMIGSSSGSWAINGVAKVMKGLGSLTRTTSLAAKMNQVLSTGAKANALSLASKASLYTSKFLNGTAKLLDASAPAIATAGMDFGYAKDNYDSALREAQAFVYTKDLNGNQVYTYEFYGMASSRADRELEAIVKNGGLVTAQDKANLIKKYADDYLKEAHSIALTNAGVTFGLTIIPDVHLSNTWRKALFSKTSRGALTDLQNRARKLFGVKPKPTENFISGIYKKDGKWFVNGKRFTYKNLLKEYGKLSAGSFLSNYLQDVGVAAGQGVQQSMLSQYIDLRFNKDVVDSVSYDFDKIIAAASQRAGHALGEYTSFRDGLYGALAPLLFNPHINVRGAYRDVTGSKTGLGKAIWKNLSMNSLAYNVTFGAKDIIRAENERRGKLHTTVLNWLNTNGDAFLSHIGGFLELSKQEKQAIKNNDYSSFQASRMGQMVNVASMLLHLNGTSPLVAMTKAYMEDRAQRADVTDSDMDRLMSLARDVQLKLESGMELREALSSVSEKDRGLVRDLIDILSVNRDINSRDSRTEVQKLNDLRDNAKEMLSIMKDLQWSMSEAEARFGDTADLVVKLEYAKIRAYQKTLQRQVDRLTGVLNSMNARIAASRFENAVSSTMPLTAQSTAILSEFGGDIDKVREEIEENRLAIATTQEVINELKSQRRAAKTQDEKDLFTKAIDMLKTMQDVPRRRNLSLSEALAAWRNLSDEQRSQTPLIAAQDMLTLSEDSLLKLLTSKNLSKELKAEVDKFLQIANQINDSKETDGSYIEILKAKLDNINKLKLASLEEGLDSRGLEILNKLVTERRQQQARDFYKKSFESMAEESQYYIPMLSDQQAYEKFVERYQQRYKEILQDDNASELLAGMHEALKDNKFYKQYQQNAQQASRLQSDINKYVDPNKFSDRERAELRSMVEFGAVMKGLGSDTILGDLSRADDNSMYQLKQYLEDQGHTVGTINDLRERLITYNNNVSETMQKNREEAEKRNAKKEKTPESKKAQKEQLQKSLVNTINTLVSYVSATQDANLSATRQLIDMLGVKDSGNITSYTNEVVSHFRDLVQKAVEEDTLEKMISRINSEINDYVTQSNGKPQMSSESIANLTLLGEYLKMVLNNSSNKLTPYSAPTIGPSITDNPVNPTNPSTPTVNITGELNPVDPYTFADMSAYKDNPLQQLLESCNPQDYLRRVGVPKGTKLVFLSNPKWTESVQLGMLDRYTDGDLPIFGAVEVTNTNGISNPIEVKDKEGNTHYYQLLGIMPSTRKTPNTALIRNKVSSSKSYSETFVITDTDGSILTTDLESNPHSQIDVDAEPTPVLPVGLIVTANNFLVNKGSDGNPTNIRVNQVPGTNDLARDRANWSYVEVQEVDATTNSEGQTVFDVEDATEFNSRTLGFTQAVNKILEHVAKNKGNIKILLQQMSGSTKEHGINQRIPNNDGTALGEFLSLANGYLYAITQNNGNVVLTIIDANKRPVKKGSTPLQWVIANNESLGQENIQSVTPISDIIKDLCQLRDSQGNLIAKWQVSYGNFDLTNGKGAELKQAYIKQAIKDKILYVKPVKTVFDVQIYPVLDLFTREKIAADNAERERQAAQRTIGDLINPVTGQPIDTNDVGLSVESALDKVRSGDFWSTVQPKLIEALGRIQLIKARVAALNAGKPKLEVNQNKQRNSTTATVQNTGVLKTPQDFCRFIVGSCVDTSVRDFFDPSMRDKMSDASYFKGLFKDVFSEQTCEELFNALNGLRETFALQGWNIISNGIYTIDEQLDNKVVGEIDLLAIDGLGNFHIIDIKTYSGNLFSDVGGKYARQVSMYRSDMMRNTGTFIPSENLHIYAIQVDNSADLYNVNTDKQSGITTITKKPTKQSKIQIKAGTRFELFDSLSTASPVSYIGDDATALAIGERREKDGVYEKTPTEDTTQDAEQRLQEVARNAKGKNSWLAGALWSNTNPYFDMHLNTESGTLTVNESSDSQININSIEIPLTQDQIDLMSKITDPSELRLAQRNVIADFLQQENSFSYETDPLRDDILEWAKSNWDGTSSSILRKYNIGFNRALKLVEFLNSQGIKGINTDTQSKEAAEKAATDNAERVEETLEEEEDIPDEEEDDSATPDSYRNTKSSIDRNNDVCG